MLHDPYNLISSQLHILDKYYEEELLPMFSSIFGIAVSPLLEYYINLGGLDSGFPDLFLYIDPVMAKRNEHGLSKKNEDILL